MTLQTSRWRQHHAADLMLAVLLALLAGAAAFLGSRHVDSSILPYDVWFGSDIPRVIANMVERESNHYRTKVHPLFSILTWPPVYVLRKLLGLWGLTAIKLMLAGVAALWAAALFALFRLIGCPRLDATIFTTLAATSAAAVFWFVVPETYAFGSFTIVLALCAAAVAQRRALSEGWYTAVGAMSMSVTITNWMLGIATAFAHLPWKRALQVIVNGFCIVVLLWAVQKYFFPKAVFFLGDREEEQFVNLGLTSRSALEIVLAFFYHSTVMPAIQEIARNPVGWPWLEVQKSLPGSAGTLSQLAVGLWTLLMVAGAWALLRLRHLARFRLVLGIALLGQLVLHLLYGEETFLYSLHFMPLLVVVAALGSLTRARWWVLGIATLLIAVGGWNNLTQLRKAAAYVEAHRSAHDRVTRQMNTRPADLWPRSTGHVVLGLPGSREVDKAYHEPGGSFSPSVGSFGVSIWVLDETGVPKEHSDNLPLGAIDQQFQWSEDRPLPGIRTHTDHYEARWTSVGVGAWRLELTPKTRSKLVVAVRSVGPAGGPIENLGWNGRALSINQRWTAVVETAAATVRLGTETQPGGLRVATAVSEVRDPEGWCFARIEWAEPAPMSLLIRDSAADQQLPQYLAARPVRSGVRVSLPDARFAASLDAQVAHLMMSTVGRELRPGDPVYYPLAWQRDGAYGLVALARAGQLALARDLSTYFAENDFFGGFGAEADAPGLSIWALEEVALRVGQREYDDWLWPHVRRKAGLILEMLAATKPMRRTAFGPVEPEYKNHPQLDLVAEPSRQGLIVGRMDWHRPLLFVNAVSYRGLRDAAALAARLGHADDATRWRDRAAALQQSWKAAFEADTQNNDRTYIAGLWPTWVADASKPLLQARLQQRWLSRRDARGNFKQEPPWTYFDVAEAHQWLMLDRPENARQTLDWFWRNQSSPGLYTWWEGTPASSHRWVGIRGWVKPNPVTPHYWTASEMLLLQLSMLGYIDQSSGGNTLVIGAGIPAEWLGRQMSVSGLSLPRGPVDWRWDGAAMHVYVNDPSLKVRLGLAFAPNTPLHVHVSGRSRAGTTQVLDRSSGLPALSSY